MPIRNKTARAPRIKKVLLAYFADEIEQAEDLDLFTMSDDEEAELWAKYGDDVVSEWIKKRPGTRPILWWAYSAPKQPDGGSGWFWEGVKPQLRMVVKGEIEDHYHLYKGIPKNVKVDKENPPVFESEAAYLRRWNLLTTYEIDVLTDEDYQKTETYFEIIGGDKCR